MNISMSESSADPRIASDPDANPMIAFRIARMIDMMSANLMAEDGEVGNFIEQ
jgi:hypothetical protein